MTDSSRQLRNGPARVRLSGYAGRQLDRGRPRWMEALWLAVSALLVESWLPGSSWRRSLLRLFGARVGAGVVIKPRVRIKFPWRLHVGDHAWLGENCWIDNLAHISIGAHACVSQGAYLCTGNHDYRDASFRLIAKPILIGDGAWVGAKAVVAPGVSLESHAIAVAGSVVTKGIPAWEIHAGNPAVFVRLRTIESNGPVSPERDIRRPMTGITEPQ